MTSFIKGLKVLCRRKVLTQIAESYTSPSSSSLFNCYQCRFKNSGKASHRFSAPPVAKVKSREDYIKKPSALETEVVQSVSLPPPQDDVYSRKYFSSPPLSFLEAIRNHKDYASAEMTDNLDGVVILDAELDLTTNKKTKFFGVPSGIILLPHSFDHFYTGRVLAITKEDEDMMKATQAGAVYTGGLSLIKKLEKGDIKRDDFDHIVLNNDMLLEAATIKNLFKDRFPSIKTGNLGTDVEGMVRLFTYGKEYEARKTSNPAIGRLTFPIGKISMEDEQLLENIKAILKTVNEHKAQIAGRKFFSKLYLKCPPSKEVFLVQDESIMPASTKSKKGKGKQAEEEVLPVEEEEQDEEEVKAAA